MIEFITNIYEQYMALAKENPVVAGVVSLWGLTVLTWLLRSLPSKIVNFLYSQFTTSITFNNTVYSNRVMMNYFLDWIFKHRITRFSRTLSLETEGYSKNPDVIVGPGYGRHYFWHKRRLFWFTKNKLNSEGSELQKEEITITTYGRNKKHLVNLVEHFRPKEDKKSVSIYHFNCNESVWIETGDLPKRPIESVALDHSLKDLLFNKINHFNDNRDWFVKRGLAHKLTFILHGKPGTGKTSTIRAIASHFDKNVCIIKLSSLTDNGLDVALSRCPKNSIIVMEDFDCVSATKDRSNIVKINSKDGSLTLSGILNALDGVTALDGCIIFMTTNHLENIDPAVYRKGRVDHVIELGVVDKENVKEYLRYLYPDFDPGEFEFKDTLGCILNAALLEARDDPEEFLNCLENPDRLEFDANKKRSFVSDAVVESIIQSKDEEVPVDFSKGSRGRIARARAIKRKRAEKRKQTNT